MAGRKRSEIIADVERHILTHGGQFGEWFVGVTANPKQALFSRHGVRSAGDAWISRRAVDDLQAGEVEDYFRTTRRTRGGGGPSGIDDVYVYAYRMKAHTRP